MQRLILFLCGLLSAGLAQAQSERALVRGRVTDGINGEALTGANIRLENTNYGTAADLQGGYELPVPAGTVTLRVSYLGYRDTVLTVEAAGGATVTQDVRLNSATVELSGVQITGRLQGQARALNQQKTADNIKNVVAADQIGRFPDPNAAEALQRVPGVNIERDQGEGRYVLVRGLAPQFTNISVNGEQIPSPEADVRFVALDAIPADQLAALEVTKALTPDMDGDAIGGAVNLITRTAQSAQPRVTASLVGGYNNLMQRPNLQGSLQYGQRFGPGERFGLMLNTSYYHNDLGSDNWEREPFDNELELRDYELTRTRLGLSSTLDYRLGDHGELYFRTLYSRFTDREWRRRYVFVPDDGEVERNTKDRFEEQSVLALNLGGRHSFPHLQLDYEVQYSYAEQDTPYDYELGFLAGLDHTVDFNPDFPVLNAPGYLDNSNYGFDALEVGNTLAQDRNLTAKVNVGLPYRVGANEGLFKFGAKVRRKEKQFDITQTVYENLGGVPNADFFAGGLDDDSFLD
ncbi:MAG: carboxypeptidase-like regulatory domain-containing protein, partial [Catalinimonas sp.]